MKINKAILLPIVAIFCFATLSAQLKETYKPKENQRTINDPIAGDWSFGAGFNVVDDGGVILGGLFEGKDYSHFSMPFTVNAEYFYNNQFSFNTVMSINKYKAGKKTDRDGFGFPILKDHEPSFFAFDLGSKFYFRDIFNDYVFEPYVSSGFGYTSVGEFKTISPVGTIIDVPKANGLTFNMGLGVNYWISTTWGVNINGVAKWTLANDGQSNYSQFSFGGFYCLNKK